MKKNIRVLLILMLSIALLAACNTNKARANDLKITDQMNREITIKGEVTKIVSLAPSATEMLFALGLGERVVGVTDSCNYPEESQSIEKVGGFKGPNLEKIVAAEPNVVFSSTVSQETVEALDQAGIPVVVLNPQNIESIYQAIELMGKVCNSAENADQLVNDITARVNAVKEKVANIKDEDKKLVYYEVWHEPPMTVGPNTFLHEVIVAAGGKNLAEDSKTDWPSLSTEQIVERNPDIILLGHGGQKAEETELRTGFKDIKAVQSKKVKAVDVDVFSRPGPRITEAIEFLAEYMYPELFK